MSSKRTKIEVSLDMRPPARVQVIAHYDNTRYPNPTQDLVFCLTVEEARDLGSHLLIEANDLEARLTPPYRFD